MNPAGRFDLKRLCAGISYNIAILLSFDRGNMIMSDDLDLRSIDLSRVSMTEKDILEGKKSRIPIPVASVDHIKHYNGKVSPWNPPNEVPTYWMDTSLSSPSLSLFLRVAVTLLLA